MRLKQHEIDAIKQSAAALSGRETIVHLFGSRVHDHIKGGDIDLLFEVEPGAGTTANQTRFLRELFRFRDERKVDIVSDADDWMAAARLRNRRVHEYSVEDEEQIARLHETGEQMPVLQFWVTANSAYFSRRGFVA